MRSLAASTIAAGPARCQPCAATGLTPADDESSQVAHGQADETERYGFIAQDLEQALPASLHDTIEKSEPQHGLALIERQNDEERTYSVSYGELFAPIVKSIQQQQQEISEDRRQNTDLRQALNALEGQFAALRAENDNLRQSLAALRERVASLAGVSVRAANHR